MTDEDLRLTDLVLVVADVVIGKDGLGTADVVALPDALRGVRALLRDEEVPVVRDRSTTTPTRHRVGLYI
jgi:hypothetical protein